MIDRWRKLCQKQHVSPAMFPITFVCDACKQATPEDNRDRDQASHLDPVNCIFCMLQFDEEIPTSESLERIMLLVDSLSKCFAPGGDLTNFKAPKDAILRTLVGLTHFKRFIFDEKSFFQYFVDSDPQTNHLLTLAKQLSEQDLKKSPLFKWRRGKTVELRKMMKQSISFDVFVNLRRMKVDLNQMFDLEMQDD